MPADFSLDAHVAHYPWQHRFHPPVDVELALSGELALSPADAERAGLTSMTLAMWRPCVAYLLIVTAVAIPGLVAVLA